MRTRLRQASEELRGQLAASAALRMGLLAALALVSVYVLLLVADGVEEMHRANANLRTEVERLSPMARERGWPERSDEARRQRDALNAMLWSGTDAALVEAGLQDWLRATATRWGVGIRELEMVRSDPEPGGSSGVHTVRVRLSTDLNMVPMLGFLSDLGQNERLVLVDRLVLRQASQPAVAEMELRVVAMTTATQEGRRQ